MAWPHRARVGLDDDIVYERKRWWLLWVPSWLGLGFYPYANAASARNKAEHQLNALANKMLDALDVYAHAEAVLEAECKDHREHYRFSQLGVGEVIHLTKKDLKGMYPITHRAEPHYRTILQTRVINAALRAAGARQGGDSKKGTRYTQSHVDRMTDVIVTTKAGREFLQPGKDASHVIVYDAEKAKKGSQGDTAKARKKQLRAENPKEDGQSQKAYEREINEMYERE